MNDLRDLLLHVLLQLAVIISAAWAGAWLLGKLSQPQVVGEIVAGLMLGPTVLGSFAPEAVNFLFPDDATIVFRVLSELGLVLLMFLIGLEFDFSHLRNRTGFVLIVAVALSITAIPILGRIMMAMMGLIAINVGRELGVVPERVFSMLVIMALVTTLLTTPLLRRLLVESNDNAAPQPVEKLEAR